MCDLHALLLVCSSVFIGLLFESRFATHFLQFEIGNGVSYLRGASVMDLGEGSSSLFLFFRRK